MAQLVRAAWVYVPWKSLLESGGDVRKVAIRASVTHWGGVPTCLDAVEVRSRLFSVSVV
jgi:hypothetical protein